MRPCSDLALHWPGPLWVSGLCRRNSAISAWFFTHRAARKRQNPSARGAWGLLCPWLSGLALVPVVLPIHRPCVRDPLFFRRYEPDQVRRVRLHCFHSDWHLSAFAHPGAARSIGWFCHNLRTIEAV
ncbi:hypothetical protein CtCNB1_3481 [Comamonas thiooxydans]|nr:hypothetical protein CtCNB1_3481 [Comamonas thiooxydans]